MHLLNQLDKTYTSIRNRNILLSKTRFYTLERVLIRSFANIIVPIIFQAQRKSLSYTLPQNNRTNNRLIVTLTSFPARIEKLWIVIECILHQSIKPDLIILWLSKDQFASKELLPKKLLDQEERGLQIKLVDGDIRSHKKYAYCLKEYPDDIFVTIDDDVMYDSKMLERLINEHRIYPNAIITNHAHSMTYTKDGAPRPYTEWQYHTLGQDDLFFIGCGGVLYPPHCLPELAKDSDLAYRLTPTGDDIWLNAMAYLNGIKIRHASYHFVSQIPVQNKRNVTLCSHNVFRQNDIQINKLKEYLKEKTGIDIFSKCK